MPGEDEISLEQLYKMLHISKRKASWMLNNGIIPCRIRPTATHRYIIRLGDVEIYLQKQRKARREEIPVGIFNAKPRKREVLLNRQPVGTVTIAECYITLRMNARRRSERMWRSDSGIQPTPLTSIPRQRSSVTAAAWCCPTFSKSTSMPSASAASISSPKPPSLTSSSATSPSKSSTNPLGI